MQIETRSIPPLTANRLYSLGGFACIYREGLKHYSGLHLVASASENCAWLHIEERKKPRPFNISQSRLAPIQIHLSHDEQLLELGDELVNVLHTEIVEPDDSGKLLSNDAKQT